MFQELCFHHFYFYFDFSKFQEMNLTGFKINTIALEPINGKGHMMKVAGWVQRLLPNHDSNDPLDQDPSPGGGTEAPNT